ncbi:MAG: ABC transporter permease [Ruminococcaceae bacterium]|nr:ABC transporter permease [Oscillospiraceae bacterium]
MKSFRIRNFVKEYSILFVLLLLAAVFTIGNSKFLTFSNFITIMRQSAIMGICGIGIMFCMIAGGINLAVGSILSIVTVLVAVWTVNWGQNWVVGMILAVIVSGIIGAIQGFIIVKGRINPMIGSLAIQMILSGTAYIICGGLPIFGIPQESKVLGQGFIWKIPVPVVILVIVAAAAAFLFSKTYMGRKIFAAGSNDEAARLAGINTTRVRIISYTICAILCGIAGIIQYGRLGSGQPGAGSEIEMNVLAAVVIGGVSMAGGEGKVFKAFLGVFLINMLINGMTLLNINDYVQRVVRGFIFLGAVLLDSYQHNKGVVTVKSVETDKGDDSSV